MLFFIFYGLFTKSLNLCNINNIVEPFKNLFTQGMVCHEFYKDLKGNWLYPEEVERVDKNIVIKIKDKTKVTVWSSRVNGLNQKKYY